MAKSNRVRMRDARNIYLLVGECCEVGWDATAWRMRMAEGLNRMIPSQTINCGAVTPGDMMAGRFPHPNDATVFDWGWDSLKHRQVFLDYWARQEVWTDPTFVAIAQVSLPAVARRRRELVDDRTWYHCPQFESFYRPADMDDCLVSKLTPPPESGLALSWLNLCRAVGDTPFTARERRILLLFAQEIATRLGIHLAVPNAAVGRGLSPRMRQVLALLTRGDSEKQVAMALGISRHTVHDHIKRLHRHFGVQSRGELLAACRHWHDP